MSVATTLAGGSPPAGVAAETLPPASPRLTVWLCVEWLPGLPSLGHSLLRTLASSTWLFSRTCWVDVAANWVMFSVT